MQSYKNTMKLKKKDEEIFINKMVWSHVYLQLCN